jgi:prepilin signal peptidase PulO-like enzyme (type II secretory pathway)
MALGAARGRSGIGRLKIPLAFVFVVLTAGFCLALGLPANEGASSVLWLGLPARAAIIIYGIGLLPIVVLPVAYALTFDTQTLNQSDIDRVRELAAKRAAANAEALLIGERRQRGP